MNDFQFSRVVDRIRQKCDAKAKLTFPLRSIKVHPRVTAFVWCVLLCAFAAVFRLTIVQFST